MCVSLHLFQHLLCSEVKHRVFPLRRQLGHRLQEEVAAWQMAVWHLKVGNVDDHLVDCHNVDVDKPVHIVAVTVAVAVALIELVLNVVDYVQRLDRGVLALDGYSHVQETVFAFKTPWLALDDSGARYHEAQVERQPQVGSPQVALAVFKIRAYVEIVNQGLKELKE